MKSRISNILLCLGALLLGVGCQNVDDRIQQMPEVFASLDPNTQSKIKQGVIDIGYTEDMVYLALGKPDEKHEKLDPSGRVTTWVYNTYYEQYDGTHFVGYYRQVYYDPYLKAYRAYYRPAYADAYHSEKEERIRVEFKGGRTTAIEQAKG